MSSVNKGQIPLSKSLTDVSKSASRGNTNAKGKVDVGSSLLRPAPKTTHSIPEQRPDMNVEPSGSPLWLSVFDVLLYDKNPRTKPNPSYNDIRESMIDRVAQAKRTGKQISPIAQPVKVTQRQPNGPYMLCAGGNTRVKIQQELYNETKDPHYLRSLFIYEPYRGEAAIISEHMIENDLRSPTCFYDKACAMVDLRAELMLERGLKSISLREMEAFLKEEGNPHNRSRISLYFFAAEKLACLTQARYELTQHNMRRLMPLYNLLAEVAAKLGRDKDAQERLQADTLALLEMQFAEVGVLNNELIDKVFDQSLQRHLGIRLSWLDAYDAVKDEIKDELHLMRILKGEIGVNPPSPASNTLPASHTDSVVSAVSEPAADRQVDVESASTEPVNSALATGTHQDKSPAVTPHKESSKVKSPAERFARLERAGRSMMSEVGLPYEGLLASDSGLVLQREVREQAVDGRQQAVVWLLDVVATGHEALAATPPDPEWAAQPLQWLADPADPLGQRVLELLAAHRNTVG